ncbi:MAG: bifunctional UDP-4-keto-pentose/UDP-xylose synthase [Desulfobulbaceae bacterium]|nr:bifunctional UDP-4-keto-pentose/UDP-xylose synthase [Desulfobulbaceae bacterium]
MNVLNLGAGGFIGSHLTRRLLTEGHHVTGIDIHSDKIEDCQPHPCFTYQELDISKSDSELNELIKKSDLVIDLIAHANPGIYVRKPLDVFSLNFVENLKIAEACVEFGKRLIQFSSCEVYGKTVGSIQPEMLKNPDSPVLAIFSEDTTPFILGPVNKHRWIYSCAKQLLERVLHAYGLEHKLNYTIIRPFNFIGPEIDYLPTEGEGIPRVFSYFMEALLNGTAMKLVGGGHHKRCYTYIDDAINCILKIVENSDNICDREIFNIGTPGNEISIRGLALLMQELYVKVFGLSPQDLKPVEDISAEEFYGAGYDDSDRRIPDISKAQNLLGWHPQYDVRQTLELSMQYYLKQSGHLPLIRHGIPGK